MRQWWQKCHFFIFPTPFCLLFVSRSFLKRWPGCLKWDNAICSTTENGIQYILSPSPMVWLLVQIKDENRIRPWPQLECNDYPLYYAVVYRPSRERRLFVTMVTSEVKMINDMQIESLRPRAGHVGNVLIHYFHIPIIHSLRTTAPIVN